VDDLKNSAAEYFKAINITKFTHELDVTNINIPSLQGGIASFWQRFATSALNT
jgi:hypothetical protein